jgi:hypothetical protein
MSDLKPGDLCEIIDHPEFLFDRECIGTYVILVSLGEPRDYSKEWRERWAPWWVVSGCIAKMVSEKLLRKLPPPVLDEDIIIEEELTV